MWAHTTRQVEKLHAGYNIVMGQGEDSYETVNSSHLYHHLQEKHNLFMSKAMKVWHHRQDLTEGSVPISSVFCALRVGFSFLWRLALDPGLANWIKKAKTPKPETPSSGNENLTSWRKTKNYLTTMLFIHWNQSGLRRNITNEIKGIETIP